MQLLFFPLLEIALVFFFSQDFYSFFLSEAQSAFSSVMSFILCRGREYGFDGDEVMHHLLGCAVSDPQAVAVGVLVICSHT